MDDNDDDNDEGDDDGDDENGDENGNDSDDDDDDDDDFDDVNGDDNNDCPPPNLSLVCPSRVAPAKTQLMSKRVNRRRIRVQAKRRQIIFPPKNILKYFLHEYSQYFPLGYSLELMSKSG